MTILRSGFVAFSIVGLLSVVSVAQQGKQGQGNRNQELQQDNPCPAQPDSTCSVEQGDNQNSQTMQGQGRRWGQGRGRGQGKGCGSQAGQGNCLNQPALTMTPLTAPEVVHVLMMRQEEKLARDVYLTLSAQWPAPIFFNISRAEQRHMDALGRVVTAQQLQDSVTDYRLGVYTDPAFKELYVTLTERASVSYVEALKVGAYIEELDILDLQESLKEVKSEYLAAVFENLMRGSFHHLRAFVRTLQTQDQTYVPQLLTQEAYDVIINGTIERAVGKNSPVNNN